jgi:hypothetical protein
MFELFQEDNIYIEKSHILYASSNRKKIPFFCLVWHSKQIVKIFDIKVFDVDAFLRITLPKCS